MAVTLTGSGGLFTRLGSLFKIVEVAEAHITDLNTRISTADGQYTSADRSQIVPLVGARDAVKAAAGQAVQAVYGAAERTLIEMVRADAPQVVSSLDLSLRELIRQMTASADSVVANAATVSVAAGSGNTGDGTVAAHIKSVANVRPETMKVRTINDGQFSGRYTDLVLAASGQEQYVPRSDPSWPRGSGVYRGARWVDTSRDCGCGEGVNMLVNSDFETFTVTNTPDGWIVVVGGLGSNLAASGTAHRGSRSYEFLGDGATLAKITQALAGGADEGTRLQPLKSYILGFWYRDGTAAPTAGVFRASIRDGSGNEVGSSNLTVTCSAATGSWQHTSILTTMPDTIPAGCRLHLELTTAIDAGKGLLIDDVYLVEAPALQDGEGVFGLHVPGTTDAVIDDVWTLTIANDWAGKFLRHFDRAFGMYERGLVLPSSGAPTISNALIA